MIVGGLWVVDLCRAAYGLCTRMAVRRGAELDIGSSIQRAARRLCLRGFAAAKRCLAKIAQRCLANAVRIGTNQPFMEGSCP